MSETNSLARAAGAATSTKTNVRTSGTWLESTGRTSGSGGAHAVGTTEAVTYAVGRSVADNAGAEVWGGAKAAGTPARADTNIHTWAIDTPRVDVAIGRVHSTACCGADVSTFAGGLGHADGPARMFVHSQDLKTPWRSRSDFTIVVVSFDGLSRSALGY